MKWEFGFREQVGVGRGLTWAALGELHRKVAGNSGTRFPLASLAYPDATLIPQWAQGRTSFQACPAAVTQRSYQRFGRSISSMFLWVRHFTVWSKACRSGRRQCCYASQQLDLHVLLQTVKCLSHRNIERPKLW